MFQPIPTEGFYETQVGQEFADRFLNQPVTNGNSILVPNERQLGNMTEEAWREQASQRFAAWFTGNYDSDTGLCTLYRGVDEERKLELEQTEAITSRTVKIFGDGDIGLAANTFIDLAKGRVSGDMKEKLMGMVDETRELLRPAGQNFLWELCSDVENAVAGVPPDSLMAKFFNVADELRHAEAADEVAYKRAVEAASADIVPPIYPVQEIFARYVHLSADTRFIIDHADRYPWTATVSFRPGELPVGPSIGYIDDDFYWRERDIMKTHLPSETELEWVGIGALIPSDEVSITVEPTKQ